MWQHAVEGQQRLIKCGWEKVDVAFELGLERPPSLALTLGESYQTRHRWIFPTRELLVFGQNSMLFHERLSPDEAAPLHLFLSCIDLWKQDPVGLRVSEPKTTCVGISEPTRHGYISWAAL